MAPTLSSYELQDDSLRWKDYIIDIESAPISKDLKERMKNEVLSDYDKMVIQHLAMRKFHVPGNGYWEDYRFWFSNNHPFLCFCLADSRHPLGTRERVMNLLSSLAFGLCATCGVVLGFYYKEGWEFDAVFVSWYGLDITYGVLFLFLFGGPFHVAFDLGFFFLQSCPPCRTNGACVNHCSERHRQCWLWMGAHIAFLITIFSMALAINVMLIRASIEDDGDDQGVARNIKHYKFLLLYLFEVITANFVVFPLGSFTVFTGILGCFVLPGLGGRPFQVRKYERMTARSERSEGGVGV